MYNTITARARAPAEASKQRPPSADTPTDARIGRQMKGENTMKHEKLITYYEQRLEKVKAAWNEDAAVDDYQRERCRAYVDAAQADLEAVKNGREW